MKERKFKNTQRGFVTKIIILIVTLVALKYAFHFDVVEYYKSAQVQGYIHGIEKWFTTIYNWVDTTVGSLLNKAPKTKI